MSPWKATAQLLRPQLLALGGVLVLAVAAVLGTQYWADDLQSQLAQLQASTRERRAQLQLKQDDLLNVKTHIQRFETLRAQGLIGEPDRAQWAEQLDASYRQLGLSEPLVYQLLAPKPLSADTGDATLQAFTHDLALELRNTHELELLNLLADFKQQAKGRFRVNRCEFKDSNDKGLTAQCQLRFVNLPQTKPASTDPQPGSTLSSAQ